MNNLPISDIILEKTKEPCTMEELLNWMEYIEDMRQVRQVRHKLKDILVIVLFATLANADDWVEIALFADTYQDYLRKYIELKNGVPSHDTISRVMAMVSPDILQQLYVKWQELLNRNEGEVLKKIICIDGKTMRSNKRNGSRPCHVVSAWSREDGFCLGQRAVEEKSNEIPAIPKLLEGIQIKGQVVTIDANGAWTVNGVVQSRAMQPLTDDNYIPGQDTSGAVTDPSTVEKITFNESLLAYKRTSDGVATFPTALENSRDNYNGLMTEYTTIYNNNPLTVYVLKSIGQITAYFGNASHFVNNIPEAGIEVNAFFENSGFEDPYGDAGGHVHGSTGNLDRVFNIPASKLRILEIKYDNGKMHHLWIQLTQGTDGNWYVYPDSPAYLG